MKRGIKGNTNYQKQLAIIPKNLEQLKTFESLIQSRLNYSGILGESYGGDRNIYQALGYSEKISYEKYLSYFKREDIAKTLIEKLPKSCWTNHPPTVTDDTPDSEFERGYEEFDKQFSLYYR